MTCCSVYPAVLAWQSLGLIHHHHLGCHGNHHQHHGNCRHHHHHYHHQAAPDVSPVKTRTIQSPRIGSRKHNHSETSKDWPMVTTWLNDLSLNGIKAQISTTIWPHFSFRKYFWSERDHKLQKRSSRFSPSSREKKTSPPHILRRWRDSRPVCCFATNWRPHRSQRRRNSGERERIATTLNVVQHLILFFY